MKYFEAVNENGVILIDDTKKHWELYCVVKPKTQTVSSWQGWNGSGVGWLNTRTKNGFDFSVSFTVPNSIRGQKFMCFYSCPGANIEGVSSSALSPLTPIINGGLLRLSHHVTNMSTKEYLRKLRIYIFSDKQLRNNSKNGVQIFGADGSVIFDSNKKYARIIDYISDRNETNRQYNGVQIVGVAPMQLLADVGSIDWRAWAISTNEGSLQIKKGTNYYNVFQGDPVNIVFNQIYKHNSVLVADVTHLQNEPVYDYIPELS